MAGEETTGPKCDCDQPGGMHRATCASLNWESNEFPERPEPPGEEAAPAEASTASAQAEPTPDTHPGEGAETSAGAAEVPPEPQEPEAPPAAETPPVPGLSQLEVSELLVQGVREKQANPSTGKTYGDLAARFLRYVTEQGWLLETLPHDALARWLFTFDNHNRRNLARSAVKTLIDVAAMKGIPLAELEIPSVPKPRKTRTTDMNQQLPAAPGPAYAPAPAAPVAAQAVVDIPSAVQQRAVPPPRKTVSGRVRVHKRANGAEGLPPGRLILVGDYDASDMVGDGGIEAFVNAWIKPRFGPAKGEPDTMYIVSELDARGNPVAGKSHEVFILAERAGGETPAAAPAQVAPQAPAAPAAQAPATAPAPSGDYGKMLIDFLQAKEAEANRKAEQAMDELKKQAGQMDAATLMLLAEKLRPPPLDVKALRAEFESIYPPPKARRDEDDFRPTLPAFPPGGLGGLGSLFPPTPPPAPPPPPEDRKTDVVLELMRENMTQTRELVAKLADRGERKERDSLEIALTLVKAMQPAAPPPDPIRDALIQQALAQSGKTKTLAESLSDLTALQGFMQRLAPSSDGPSVGEVLMAAFENADKLAPVLGAIFRPGAAPQLPRPAAPAPAAPAPAAAQPAPQKRMLPAESQKQILAMRDAADDDGDGAQKVVESVYGLIFSLSQSPDPFWQQLAQKILAAFLKADSKAELRSLVRGIFVNCGAVPIANDDKVVAKVTRVLHKHYSFLYSSIADYMKLEQREKVLADADEAKEAPPAEPAPRKRRSGIAGRNGEVVPPLEPLSAEAPDAEEDDEGDDDEGEEDDEEEVEDAAEVTPVTVHGPGENDGAVVVSA